MEPDARTYPMPRWPSLVFAQEFALAGYAAAGLMLLCQQRKGWRPDETCSIRPEDVTVVELVDPENEQSPGSLVLRLGERTKA